MTVLQRDKHYHTYADYLTWSRDYGDELINGTAYVREPPAPGLSHQRVVGEIHRQVANALKGKPCRVYDRLRKVPAYERAGVRELWLVHPLDRTLTLYRLEAGRYGRATRLDLKGQTPLTAVPGVTIDWDEVLAEIS